MKQFLSIKIHGINSLLLIVFTLLLIYSPLSSSIDLWFSDSAYFSTPKNVIGRLLLYTADFSFFLCLLCVATLWIPKLNNWLVVLSMVVYILLLVNLVYPNFNMFFSSFYLPLIIVLCILWLVIRNYYQSGN